MNLLNFHDIFTKEKLNGLFPAEKADAFFDALFGDPKEGAYNIELVYKDNRDANLIFEFHLKQRENKCLACNLTHGLPEVFMRHPVINVKRLAEKIVDLLGNGYKLNGWELLRTKELSRDLHTIPFIVSLSNG